MNAQQTADFIGLAPKTVRKLTSERRIPFIRISARCVRYDRTAIEEWLRSRMVKVKS